MSHAPMIRAGPGLRLLAAGAALLIAAGAAAQGLDVKVNQDAPGLVTNETSLTLVPTAPGWLVMAYNDHPYPGGPGLGISFSPDGGVTWFDRQLAYPMVPPYTFDTMFDPVIMADGQGRVFASGISTEPTGWSGLFLYRSLDNGNTWNQIQQIDLNGPPRLTDKPHASVNRNPGSPYEDYLYFAWIVDAPPGPFSDIRAAYAWNGGLSASVPVQISDLPTGAGMGNGPSVAVAVDDTVYVAWIDCDVTTGGSVPGVLMLDRSNNGGVTWGNDTFARQITTVPSRLSNFIVAGVDAVARSYPCLATSPTNPMELYMVYAADPDGAFVGDEADVYCMRSTDGGMNWMSPRQLNMPAAVPGHDFEPWIAVKPNGDIDVAWYESQFNPGVCLWNVMFARSVDGGFTFSTPITITDTAFPTPTDPFAQRWMGEYLALVVDQTDAYIGFTSSVSDGFGDVYFDRLPNATVPIIKAGDLNRNYVVNITDLLQILQAWGQTGIRFEDLNLDGVVDINDLLILLGNWGPY